jgi:Bifunctional DNA primase/polymerase, N-terminal
MDPHLQKRVFHAVEYCANLGISLVPLGQGKTPARKWGQDIGKPTDPKTWPRGCNIAILTGQENGIVVVDCDNMASAAQWRKYGTPTPLMAKTRRGVHFYYRHPGVYIKSDSHIKVPGTDSEYDVKGDKSYVVFPPSMFSGHQYSFVYCDNNPCATLLDFKTLPLFDPAWRPDNSAAEFTGRSQKIGDPLKYIRYIQAVAGQGGHNSTWRAVNRLKDGGLTEMEAVAAMVEWNKTNAEPPWSIRDLIHKVKSCYGS